MYIDIKGLSPGLHGFHIHENGELNEGCQSAGGHFNPFGKNHGPPWSEDRHVGALGNIWANKEGVAKLHLEDHLVQLFGPDNVIGRSFVVHAKPDDLGGSPNEESRINGNSGARLACGDIRLTPAFELDESSYKS